MGADTPIVKKKTKEIQSMTTNISNETSWLGRRPVKQGPHPQSRNQGWVEKSTTGMKTKKLKIAKDELTVGTWNVRTLWAAGHLELLKEEMKRYRCDILGLSEVRWTGAGEVNGCEMIWSGDETEHQRGVGFLLNSRARMALLGYKPVNARMIVARFSGQPFNISVIQVYAPTTDSTEEEIEQFYENLDDCLKQIPKKDVRVIMGDWNAKIGKDNTGWERVMLKNGYGDRNERGERLLEFALRQDLLICNTKFQQKDCRKWTWKSPDGRTTNMIDLILIDKRWSTSVRLCRSFQGADIASDHSLVLCNVKLKLKWLPRRIYVKRRNLEILKNEEKSAEYATEIENRIASEMLEGMKVNQKTQILNKIVKQVVEMLVPETEKKKNNWISEVTLKLAKEKREVRLQTKECANMVTRYKELCKQVKKSARKDKQDWMDKQCSEMEKYAGQYRIREVYKMVKNITRKWQPRQSAIKDREGKILMEREKVRERWTEYCRELYEDKEKTDGQVHEFVQELKEISPPQRIDEKEDILEAEVERAIEQLKNNKSPGLDGITSEMIKAGGHKLMKEIHGICNQIWRGESTPEEWIQSVLVTIPKKGDLTDCRNYRTIALMSHVGKIFMMILLERLKAQTEEHLADEQAGFRKDRNTVQQILLLRLIAEKAKRKGREVYNCFIDFEKAFDSVYKDVMWATLQSYGIGKRLIEILKDIGDRSRMAVRVGQDIGEWFEMSVGTKQGDPISPNLFITLLERVMDKVRDSESGISVGGMWINNLRFADDIDLIDEEQERLQKNTQVLQKEGNKAGLKINMKKTKTMVFGKKEIDKKLEVMNQAIENVEEFVYLGSLITWDNDCSKDIRTRIAKGKGMMENFKTLWRNKNISFTTKLNVLKTCVFSTMLYGCETWTYRKADKDRILAFEMYCYRRMLGIRWMQKISNEEVRRRLDVKENLMQVIMKRKLGLFGHVCRMDNSRKIKSVMFGMMNGTTRRGRPSREWLNDIEDWCGKDLHSLSLEAQDRVRWRSMIDIALNTYGHCAHGL